MFKAASVSPEIFSANTTALAGTTASAKLTVVTTLQALRDLEHKWRALEVNVQNHSSVFQSYDWVIAWAETYMTGQPDLSLHVLAGYDGDELVFLWPLMRSTRMGFSTLTWLTEPFGQYGDVLCRKNQNTTHWVGSAITFLRRLKDVDILRLRHVRADSHLAVHATQFLNNARMPEGAPFLDLTQYENEAAYDLRYNSVQRRRRKKIRKALEDMGSVTFTLLPSGTVADGAMRQAIDEKSAWLAERGRINRVLKCPAHLTFLKNLSRRMGGTVQVIVSELKTGESPVSWEISFRHRGTHYGYITSHMNALTNMSPGRLHMDLSQRACLSEGVSTFDLMVPNDTHKESWSSGAVDTNDYYLPLSMSGAVMGHVVIRTLRPWLRAAYYRMNDSTLRKLNWLTRIRQDRKHPEES